MISKDLWASVLPLYSIFFHLFFILTPLGFSLLFLFREGSFSFYYSQQCWGVKQTQGNQIQAIHQGWVKVRTIQPKLIRRDVTNPPSYNSFESHIISISIYQMRTGSEGDSILPTSQEYVMMNDSLMKYFKSAFPEHSQIMFRQF